jgi:hypothetical protein
MRRSLIALLAPGLFAVSCVEEDAAMYIEGVLPLVADNECSVSAGDNVFQPFGILDLAAASGGYTTFLKVRTNLPATFNNQQVQQSRQQSPNYPDYGAVDNNVVIFESAAVTFEFASDEETVALLAAAAARVGGAAANLDCDGGVCSGGNAPEIIPAGGTAFNQQTSLSTPTVVVTDLLSASTAATLRAVYETAVDVAGRDVALERQLLAVPGQRQRVNFNVALTGKTTGSGDLRPVVSAPFPFGIDICFGCLAPNQAVCDDFDAQAIDITDAETCALGVDAATSVCGCVDATGAVFDIVRNDADACQP